MGSRMRSIQTELLLFTLLLHTRRESAFTSLLNHISVYIQHDVHTPNSVMREGAHVLLEVKG